MEKYISKSKLKAKMLEIFRYIEESGEEITVTDRGKPVLKIVPLKKGLSVKEAFGPYQSKVRYHEDLNTPTLAEWEDLE
jgi:antitoxin (DNA-binding transcriptional repressor) of toxin-antitoxin stability system